MNFVWIAKKVAHSDHFTIGHNNSVESNTRFNFTRFSSKLSVFARLIALNSAQTGRPGSLLYYMGQFVGQNLLALGCSRLILSFSKDNIWAGGVSQGIDVLRRFSCRATGMHSHKAKI